MQAQALPQRPKHAVEQHAGIKKPPPRQWGLLGGHMCAGHSPPFHNAGITISFRSAEMHFLREASADFSWLPGNHPRAASLCERTIESRRPLEPPGRRHGGKGSAVLETPPFDRDPTHSLCRSMLAGRFPCSTLSSVWSMKREEVPMSDPTQPIAALAAYGFRGTNRLDRC